MTCAFLTRHDKAIKALSDKLQKTRAQAAPKPKFSFKKKNASAISINDAAELAAKRRLQTSTASSATSSIATTPLTLPQTPANEEYVDGEKPEQFRGVRMPSFSNASSISISSHSNVHIMLPSSAAHATSSGTVSNIRHSVVDMSISSSSAFAALTLKNITNSLIICGHVSGAIHITGVKDSVIVVATRQFRMHESSNVKVYLLCKKAALMVSLVTYEPNFNKSL